MSSESSLMSPESSLMNADAKKHQRPSLRNSAYQQILSDDSSQLNDSQMKRIAPEKIAINSSLHKLNLINLKIIRNPPSYWHDYHFLYQHDTIPVTNVVDVPYYRNEIFKSTIQQSKAFKMGSKEVDDNLQLHKKKMKPKVRTSMTILPHQKQIKNIFENQNQVILDSDQVKTRFNVSTSVRIIKMGHHSRESDNRSQLPTPQSWHTGKVPEATKMTFLEEEDVVRRVLGCKEGEWQCHNGSECIPQELVCSGILDCKDESDELETMCGKENLKNVKHFDIAYHS